MPECKHDETIGEIKGYIKESSIQLQKIHDEISKFNSHKASTVEICSSLKSLVEDHEERIRVMEKDPPATVKRVVTIFYTLIGRSTTIIGILIVLN